MLKLIKKEIFHRKINFLLGVVAVFLAVTLFVAFLTTSEASKRETIRLTRDMGFNLRIVPENTDMDTFWHDGYSSVTMPQENIIRFMTHKDFSFAHLTATLYQKVIWQNMEVVLTGISDEFEPSGIQKSPMVRIIGPGSLVVGFEVARRLNLTGGETVSLLDKRFKVAKTLAETGSSDDIHVYARLEEVQDLLNMKGRINEIRALNCLCLTTGDEDPLLIIRNQLQTVLPESKVIMDKNIALTREKQRLMFEKYFAFLIPFIIVFCAVWIGTMALINVRDRRYEIGVLRALGYHGTYIAGLFLGRAVFIGLLGALLGYLAGTIFSLIYGPEIFKVTASAIKPMYNLLSWSLLAAIGFSVVSALLPTMVAITQDPAQILRGE